MISLRSCLIGTMVIASLLICGCGGNAGPDPEQTALALFHLEWSDSLDASWHLFHPVWQRNGWQDNFIHYANTMTEKNRAWAEHPRTITRSKQFSGEHIPIRAEDEAKRLDRGRYDFAVVRIAVEYPPAPGYRGGVVEYLITLAKKKERGAPWRIISLLDQPDPTEFFNW